MEKKQIYSLIGRLTQVSYSNENVIDTSFKRCHQLNDVKIRPSGTGLSDVANCIRVTSAQRLSRRGYHHYWHTRTRILTHRRLASENYREVISALFGVLSSPRMTMVRVGADDGVVVLRRCLEIEEGTSSRTETIVSHVILVTKRLRQFSLRSVAQFPTKNAGIIKRYVVETHCRSLMRGKPLFASSAVVTIKRVFYEDSRKSLGDLCACSAKPTK